MDNLNSDLLISIISYLNIVDSSRLSTSCRRFLYLIDQFHAKILPPEIIACSNWDGCCEKDSPSRHTTVEEDSDDDFFDSDDDEEADLCPHQRRHRTPSALLSEALSSTRSLPNFAFTFTTPSDHHCLPMLVAKSLPEDAVILGSYTSDIQSCLSRVEANSSAALMLGSFPRDRTTFEPFCLESEDETPHRTLQGKLCQATPSGDDVTKYWKVLVVYACGSACCQLEQFVSGMQRMHPDMVIVGGIADAGHIRLPQAKGGREEEEEKVSDEKRGGMTKGELTRKTARQLTKIIVEKFGETSQVEDLSGRGTKEHLVERAWEALEADEETEGIKIVEDEIFGLAMGGDVPVRSIVSRGVRSLTSGKVGSGDSSWTVADTTLIRPGEERYPFRGDADVLKPVHMIRTVRNAATGESVDALSFVMGVARSSGSPDFVGLRRVNGDGFEMNTLSDYTTVLGCFTVMTDGCPEGDESFEGANIDLFKLDGGACLEDMDLTLARLQDQTKDEKILGGIMFSCSGRGPSPRGLINEPMADATKFHEHFPNVPCLGFYAGGEIGPEALAGNQNIFQKGRAAVQGFTAVFALFIVPDVEVGTYHMDDGEESIARHIRARLRRAGA